MDTNVTENCGNTLFSLYRKEDTLHSFTRSLFTSKHRRDLVTVPSILCASNEHFRITNFEQKKNTKTYYAHLKVKGNLFSVKQTV